MDEREQALQELNRGRRWFIFAAVGWGGSVSLMFLAIAIGKGWSDWIESRGWRTLGAMLFVALPLIGATLAAWWYVRRASCVVHADGSMEIGRKGRWTRGSSHAVIARMPSKMCGLAWVDLDIEGGQRVPAIMLEHHIKTRLNLVPQSGADGPSQRSVRRADGSQALLTDRWRVANIHPSHGCATVYEPSGKGRRSHEAMVTILQLIRLYDAAQLAPGESQPIGRLYSSRVMFVAFMLAMFFGFLALSSWQVVRGSRAALAPAGAPKPRKVAADLDDFSRIVSIGRYGSLGGLGAIALGLVLVAKTGESSPEGFIAGRRVLRRTRMYPWRGATLDIRFGRSSDRAEHRLRTSDGRTVTLSLRLRETSIVLRHARLGGARIEHHVEVVPPPPWLVDAGVQVATPPSASGAKTVDVSAPDPEPISPS